MQEVFNNTGPHAVMNTVAVEWFETDRILRKLTKDFTLPYADLTKGAQEWAIQRIPVLNALCDTANRLGFNTVHSVLGHAMKDTAKWMQETYDGFIKEMLADPSVKAVDDELKAEAAAKIQELQSAQAQEAASVGLQVIDTGKKEASA